MSADVPAGRKVLVVTTVEHGGDGLRASIGDDTAELKVVVPVVKQGFLDWLANDERAFARAEEVAAETADELPVEKVDSAAGEANVALAIRDALATFPADEVVVVVGPGDREVLAERLEPDAGEPRTVDGVPLRFLVLRGGD